MKIPVNSITTIVKNNVPKQHCHMGPIYENHGLLGLGGPMLYPCGTQKGNTTLCALFISRIKPIWDPSGKIMGNRFSVSPCYTHVGSCRAIPYTSHKGFPIWVPSGLVGSTCQKSRDRVRAIWRMYPEGQFRLHMIRLEI